jgi:Raf kinase inhibitor-like YbhB/YbcL family protein
VNKTISIGLLALVLAACGDDGASDTSDTAADSGTVGATSSPTTTNTDASVTMTTPGTGSESSGDPTNAMTSSTSDATSSTGADSSGEGSTGEVAFALTSPSFAEGQVIPGIHHAGGGNISPQLDWVGVPGDALSLGVFFHDLSINNPHSGIWNISTDMTGLPEGVEGVAMPPSVPGAVQCRNWMMEFGYGGMGSPSNDYEFTVYALDVATLDGEIDQNTPRATVRQTLIDHAIATATLGGQSGGPNAPGN